ncbi:PREDICTED: collagen alpha-1(XI) chain-like [Nipponia nippon]|uniref:collagen alpha-1(XI) chain-like n=1 Tax=Nipponia nippon TaxID=128390 RepID=UPI0005116790|nr:PREDICTED: collagen alpha-1(XI) chain-like [Nipponia nippon]
MRAARGSQPDQREGVWAVRGAAGSLTLGPEGSPGPPGRCGDQGPQDVRGAGGP